jgi:hypothetical protein
MMDAWATFWGVLLIAVLVVFAVLSVAITIGGFFDIKALLASIEAQHKGSDNDTPDDAGKTD